MSPSVAKTPKKVRNYWEDQLNRHQSEKKKQTKQKRKTKVIKGKQLKLNQFSLNNFTEQQQSKANILKFRRDKQTLFGLL